MTKTQRIISTYMCVLKMDWFARIGGLIVYITWMKVVIMYYTLFRSATSGIIWRRWQPCKDWQTLGGLNFSQRVNCDYLIKQHVSVDISGIPDGGVEAPAVSVGLKSNHNHVACFVWPLSVRKRQTAPRFCSLCSRLRETSTHQVWNWNGFSIELSICNRYR